MFFLFWTEFQPFRKYFNFFFFFQLCSTQHKNVKCLQTSIVVKFLFCLLLFLLLLLLFDGGSGGDFFSFHSEIVPLPVSARDIIHSNFSVNLFSFCFFFQQFFLSFLSFSFFLSFFNFVFSLSEKYFSYTLSLTLSLSLSLFH